MTRTGLQVITDALKLLGVVAGHENPTSAEQQDAFSRLNEMIDSWGLQSGSLLVQRRDVVPLTIGQQVYQVGPGLAVDLPVPVTLEAVSYVLPGSPATEVFLAWASDVAAIATAQKTLGGLQPQTVNYSRTHAYGELWVWPVPSVAQDLVLYWSQPLAAFPDLVTPVDLAAGYARALRYNLAVELMSEFGRPPDPVIHQAAKDALADVKRANFPMVEIGLPAGLGTCSGRYDILSDS